MTRPWVVYGYSVAVSAYDAPPGADPYFAYLRILPGCGAQGRTIDECFSRLASVVPWYLQQNARLGVNVPPPDGDHGFACESFAWSGIGTP